MRAVDVTDLEAALLKRPPPAPLLTAIVQATWDLIAAADFDLHERVRTRRDLLPLTRLFMYLFQSANRQCDVITPNYDRVVEYAADAGDFIHYRGFGYGFFPRRDGGVPSKIYIGAKRVRTVNVWKVHGSVDWFVGADGNVFADPMTRAIPKNASPAIVTPGRTKFEATHNEPFRTIMAFADQALMDAEAYLCIGYGFNDKHIQPKLVERIRRSPVPVVILTKSLSRAAMALIGQCKNYLAMEEAPLMGLHPMTSTRLPQKTRRLSSL